MDLHVVGAFEGGEVGATDVRGADGSRYVLKWWEGDAARARVVASLVERLRAAGYPAPRFVIADDFDGVAVMLQEFVEGEVSDTVADSVVDRLVALNHLQVASQR